MAPRSLTDGPLTVGVDATPLIGQRSGVGRYVTGLLGGLASHEPAPEIRLTLFSLRGRVPQPLPAGTRMAPRQAPARALRPLWQHVGLPPVEVLCGRVDVFHGTNFVLPPTARAGGVVTVHDLAYLRYPHTVSGDSAQYRDLVPTALRRARQVVAVSHAMAQEIQDEYAVGGDRLTVAHHGVDPAWGTAAPAGPGQLERLGLPPRYLLFTGNLEPRKNLGTLVRAHRAARRASPEVPPLVLVGPQGWGDRWEGEVPDPDDVVLAGYLDEEDLHAVVAAATAVAMPSHYEGFGLPVLEALAAGRPVLASDIPAHREVTGGWATLLPATAAEEWSQALVDVSEPSDLGADPHEHGRRAHAARFTWAASAQAHLGAYRRATGS